MGSLPHLSVVIGERRSVPVAPISKHFENWSTSDEVALLYHDEAKTHAITYSELESRANAIARCLISLARPSGCNADGDYIIAVCMQPNHNTVTSLLSIWKAGAAFVPLEPSFPQARVSHILRDAQPSLVIYDDSVNPSMFADQGVPTISFTDLLQEARNRPNDKLRSNELLSPLRSGSVAFVLYTSGSTGIPKGVRLTYDAICNRLWWQFNEFPYSEDERTCVWKTAITFVDSVCEIWAPLITGRTLLILSRETTRDPQKLVQMLADHQIQRLVLVPTLLKSILMYLSINPNERPLQKLTLWVCSGEALSKELAAEFFKYFGDDGHQLANFYGSTEVMGDVTYYLLENSAQLDLFPTIPIGFPLHNCAVYLLEADMSAVRSGCEGEIYVSGCNLAAGYVRHQGTDKFQHNAHATEPEFTRLYRTGDFGVLEKGMILYRGRTDSQIKIRGHRVDLQEIECAVNNVAGVEKGIVLCYGAETGNPEILAFVTLTPDARLGARHIEAALKNTLTSYMIPQVILIEKVPLLVNGKVDRQLLLKLYENTNNNDDSEVAIEYDYNGVEPDRLEAARVLFSTVAAVLGRAARGALSVRVGFYELGGNSLNSIYTITQLRNQGYYIQISDFLSAANLGEVLANLSSDPDSEEQNEGKFHWEMMGSEHKEHVVNMIISSFYEKAELEQYLKQEITPLDYKQCVEACWDALLAARLSVVLRAGSGSGSGSGSPIAVALNFDARDEPEIELSGGIAKILAFLDYVESSVRDTMLPAGKGTILHSFMMATASTLNARDNVRAIKALEHATLRVARDRRFQGVFTTNTSPLTQQLGSDVLGFQTLLDYQINQYVDSNGERPFGAAMDDERAIVCWKPVN